MHVIIGAGEVGTALAEVLRPYYDVHLRDIEPSGPPKAEVLHICFPYFKDFDLEVSKYIVRYDPDITIVHSTVPVGTCEALGVTHSPVRGQHPNLAKSIRTFVKFFGGVDAQRASDLFESIGIRTQVTNFARDTEAGKLWELAQYGIAIAVEKQIHDYCENNNVDFNVVYTQFAKTYNDGYASIDLSQYVRPLLRHIPGPIGGHCVVSGSNLLNHPLIDLINEAGVNENTETDSSNLGRSTTTSAPEAIHGNLETTTA